jgi:hypothetical protein
VVELSSANRSGAPNIPRAGGSREQTCFIEAARRRLTKRSSVSSQFDTSRSPTLHRHNNAQGADDMKPFWIKTAAVLCMLVASCVASAASELTPAECNDYPFKPLSKPVTHAQLMQ